MHKSLWDVYFHLEITKEKKKDRLAILFYWLKGINITFERKDRNLIYLYDLILYTEATYSKLHNFFGTVFITSISLSRLLPFVIFHGINEFCFPFQKKKKMYLNDRCNMCSIKAFHLLELK